MTKNDYFKRHLPHRVNLLTTFRVRFGPGPEIPGREKLKREDWRDLFRCSKDIAMLMVRFFCGEMGAVLPRPGEGTSNGADLVDRKENPRFKTQRLTAADAHRDPRYPKLLAVMKAANRAVAHINPKDVDHAFRTEVEDRDLCEVIVWIEDLVRTRIYQENGESLEVAMALQDNVMTRPGAK
jgi:hypothetical protein